MDGNDNGPARGARLGSWRGLIPLSAAALAAFAVAGGLDAVDRHQKAGARERSAAAASAHERVQLKKKRAAEPKYVVGVRRTGSALVVRDARTGRDVGLPVAAPSGATFQRVASAGEGTYVVASATRRAVTFSRLKLDSKGRPRALTEIAGTSVPGRSTPWSDLAVSADGRRIAYVTYTGKAGRVDVVSSTERKTWTTRSAARISSLSFAGDTLAFVWNPVAAPSRHQVRTLDTAAAPGDLRTSRPVLLLPPGGGPALLSRDGATIVAGIVGGASTTLRAYSVQTGKPTEDLWKQKAEVAALAPDPTGGHLLAATSDGTLYGARELPVRGADLTDVAW
ncbi:hypothetical protein BTM25_10410 [Actinomadura rubteroloni]|uniref:WD40 repeat domain-containing protein n=1 Tax=Actinomadura rubteroloni TaxID=1926885 RepID=A0A2P4UNL3_9ACTN|nr:hypothetical protein [Actinomadura rubteroloni]POM26638.1 hypothetical protein BTM25_10410 [Actinomadura rubteroloni]